jgi:hypothetical protein
MFLCLLSNQSENLFEVKTHRVILQQKVHLSSNTWTVHDKKQFCTMLMASECFNTFSYKID